MRRCDSGHPDRREHWSVAVLAFNEEGTLWETVRRTDETLAAITQAYDILIVDDASTDGTYETAQALAAQFATVHVVRHETNRGIGHSLRTAYRHLEGDVVGVLPGDLQYPPEGLRGVSKALQGCDCVEVVRAERQDPLRRRLISCCDRWLVRALFGLHSRDLHWVKIYRRWIIDAVGITSTTPLVDTELLVKAVRLGARRCAIAQPHMPRAAGCASGGNLHLLIRTFLELLRFRWKLRRGRVVAPNLETQRSSAQAREDARTPGDECRQTPKATPGRPRLLAKSEV